MATDVLAGRRIALASHLDFNLYRFRMPLARALRGAGAEVLTICPPGPYLERMAGEGLRALPMPMERSGLSPLAARRAVGRMAGLLSTERVDLVQSFTLRPNAYAGRAVARLGGTVRHVAAVTGRGALAGDSLPWSMRLKARAVELYTRRSLGRSDAVVFQNPEDRDHYLQRGLIRPEQARLIISSGVDLDEFDAAAAPPAEVQALREELSEGGRRLVVLMVARLVRSKGVLEFLEAGRQLGDRVRFVHVGGGDTGSPDPIADDELAGYEGCRSVSLLGPRQDVGTLLAACDVFALPTAYGEGVPRTILEAMAAGRPVVTSDAPGCREAIRDGQEGRLVPARDSAALARAVAGLADDPEARKAMGRRARARVEAQFDARFVAEQYLELYRELLGRDAA